MRRHALAIVLVTSLTASAGIARAGDQQAVHAIQLAAVPGDLLAAPVTVNGAGPFWFLLDTGSTTTLITPEAAAKAGVAVLSRARLITPAGATEAAYGRIDALSLGPLPPRPTDVVVAPLTSLMAGDAPLDGVLGNDVLRDLNFALDVGRRQLTVDPDGRLATDWAAEAHPTSAQGGRFTVAARAGDRDVDLVVDSGSSRWVFFDAPDGAGAPGAIAIGTANAAAAARSVRVGELRIGRLSLGDVDALQLPGSPGRTGHGLLPLTQFRHIYVNNREGWIALR